MLPDDLTWKGKLLVFTWHAKKELDAINKPLEFVIVVLDEGKHYLVSKKQNKYNVFFPFKKKILCLSYVGQENIIIIHIKPKRK